MRARIIGSINFDIQTLCEKMDNLMMNKHQELPEIRRADIKMVKDILTQVGRQCMEAEPPKRVV